jgi:hypothetical protein
VLLQTAEQERMELLNFSPNQLCRLYRQRWEHLLPPAHRWRCMMEGNDERVLDTVARLKQPPRGPLREIDRLLATVPDAALREVLEGDLMEAVGLKELGGSPECLGSFLYSRCFLLEEAEYSEDGV